MVGIKIKKRDLEIILQKLPPNTSPIIHFEQYTTPANIAADILFTIYQEGNITGNDILDLGCGTGIFSIGSKLLGAAKVVGVDIDGNGLTIAEAYANELSIQVEFFEKDVTTLSLKDINKTTFDSIIQNPPFGAQKSARGADRRFLEKAVEFGKIIYSLHLTKTMEFIELLVNKLGRKIEWKMDYQFPISNQFFFHNNRSKDFDVTLIKIVK
jgi:putative methylase